MRFPSLRDRVDIIVRILFGSFIAIGCLLVVWPFATAISVAAVIAVVTWPLFRKIRKFCCKSSTVASLVLVFILTILIVVPITGLSTVSARRIPQFVQQFREWISQGFTAPESLKELPYIGDWLYSEIAYILSSQQELVAFVQKIVDPMSTILLKMAVMLGDGLFQMALMLCIIFFFYRDGEYLGAKCYALLERMSGDLANEVSHVIINTTRSVVLGIVGSAAGQGIVSFIGFWIADVPGAITLGVAVFILSVVPIGPPMIWGPVAIWLYYQNEVGMAIFLVLWGALAVSSVDNFLKPILISKGAALPLSLIYLGVFGGVLAFGFMGIILGPVLIAVGLAMSKTWLSVSKSQSDSVESDDENLGDSQLMVQNNDQEVFKSTEQPSNVQSFSKDETLSK
ncbi:MAG: AI-2E family transporter [Burkholderiaceae bacterium]|nr:AI-2E family transporter [Burkholderiaceae bacterium]